MLTLYDYTWLHHLIVKPVDELGDDALPMHSNLCLCVVTRSTLAFLNSAYVVTHHMWLYKQHFAGGHTLSSVVHRCRQKNTSVSTQLGMHKCHTQL